MVKLLFSNLKMMMIELDVLTFLSVMVGLVFSTLTMTMMAELVFSTLTMTMTAELIFLTLTMLMVELAF